MVYGAAGGGSPALRRTPGPGGGIELTDYAEKEPRVLPLNYPGKRVPSPHVRALVIVFPICPKHCERRFVQVGGIELANLAESEPRAPPKSFTWSLKGNG